MTVFVVLEEDRGFGAMVVGVYRTKEAAEAACYSSEHSVVEETVQ